MEFPYPVFVCDVGGTNVRIGIVAERGADVRQILNEPVTSHSGLEATIKSAAQRTGTPARSVVVCAAGPVEGGRVRLTNADWTIDGAAVAAALDLGQGLLLNDFEAQAIALPHIWAAATLDIAPGEGVADAPRLVLGPGTGLGAAALLRAGAAWLPVTTEAGHMGLGPGDAEEELIWPHLERVDGRVTAESVLSGPGLRRVHAAVRAARHEPAVVRAEWEIASAAKAGEQAAIETIRLFWRIVARFSGDLALAFLARGGVTLSGGVLPHLTPWLDAQDFRRTFADKAPMAAMVAAMPVRLVTASGAVLGGMAALAANPESYAIDYASRAWRPRLASI